MSVRIGLTIRHGRTKNPSWGPGPGLFVGPLQVHSDRQPVQRLYTVGYQRFNEDDLLRCREEGQRMRVWVLGMLRLTNDVSPALAYDTIDDVAVVGWFRARPGTKRALWERHRRRRDR